MLPLPPGSWALLIYQLKFSSLFPADGCRLATSARDIEFLVPFPFERECQAGSSPREDRA